MATERSWRVAAPLILGCHGGWITVTRGSNLPRLGDAVLALKLGAANGASQDINPIPQTSGRRFPTILGGRSLRGWFWQGWGCFSPASLLCEASEFRANFKHECHA